MNPYGRFRAALWAYDTLSETWRRSAAGDPSAITLTGKLATYPEGCRRPEPALRKKRPMTLIHLYLVFRYKVDSVHQVSPTDDRRALGRLIRTED